MTWSVVARDASGAFGVAVASRFFAVGAQEIVHRLTAADEGRDVRQFHVVDAAGRTAAHTGAACVEWCGALAGHGFSVAGNMLAGPGVIEETARAFEGASACPSPSV